MCNLVVLSARQVAPLLASRERHDAQAVASLDLGRSSGPVELRADGIVLPDGSVLGWEHVMRVAKHPDPCWLVRGGAVERIHAFSEQFQRAYSLLDSESAPTLINSGFTMHRIKRSNPRLDTLNKIRAIGPIHGRVLDTTTGLGYTAIESARTADEVVTIEIDQTVLDVARRNPWSRELFTTPTIRQVVGDSYDEITRLTDASFDVVIHDPPAFSLAGELYSAEFYRQVLRVLRPTGRLFHYTGNPNSKQGATVTRGAVRRLRDAGFTHVVDRPSAFGVLAKRFRSGSPRARG